MRSLSTLQEIPTPMVTVSLTLSIHLQTAFLLWKKTLMMMVTASKTSMKPTRVLPTVTPTQEPTRSTQIPTTTAFATDQSMSMTLKATSSVLQGLMRLRLAKKPQAWCTASIIRNSQALYRLTNYRMQFGKFLRTFLLD